ncbi:hypothetical protein JG688_00012883, partial [Phytophthora aleatoria]
MRNELDSARFTTPTGFLHAFEDRFLKEAILPATATSAEWNDLVVHLANCLGLNVLLLADDRTPVRGIQLTNLDDVDSARPALVLLKRSNLEWARDNSDTRAMYLPVTTNSFRALAKSRLVLPRFDIGGTLAKIKRVTRAAEVQKHRKQFSLQRCRAMIAANAAQYALVAADPQRKLAAVRVGDDDGARLVATVASLGAGASVTFSDDFSATLDRPTAWLRDALAFIMDYNTFTARSTARYESLLRSYSLYLSVALKDYPTDYGFIDLEAFLPGLPIMACALFIHQEQVIGAVVHLADDGGKWDSSELLFFSPMSTEAALADVGKAQERLRALHTAIDAEAILSFPLSASMVFGERDAMFARWINHPLSVSNRAATDAPCKASVKEKLDKGVYMDTIYQAVVNETIVERWMVDRPAELEQVVSGKISYIMDDNPTEYATVSFAGEEIPGIRYARFVRCALKGHRLSCLEHLADRGGGGTNEEFGNNMAKDIAFRGVPVRPHGVLYSQHISGLQKLPEPLAVRVDPAHGLYESQVLALPALQQYSWKYAKLAELCMTLEGKIFVYHPQMQGSGVNLLTSVLLANGLVLNGDRPGRKSKCERCLAAKETHDTPVAGHEFAPIEL